MLLPNLILSIYFISTSFVYFGVNGEFDDLNYLNSGFFEETFENLISLLAGFFVMFIFYKRNDDKPFHLKEWLLSICFFVVLIPIPLGIDRLDTHLPFFMVTRYNNCQMYVSRATIWLTYAVFGIILGIIELLSGNTATIRFKFNPKRFWRLCLPVFLIGMIAFLAVYLVDITLANYTNFSGTLLSVYNAYISFVNHLELSDFAYPFDFLFGFLLVSSFVKSQKRL